MALATAVKNSMLDHMAGLITHLGLANSGTELTGGGYARQAISWNAAAAGSVAMAAAETFDVPAGATVNQVLFRDASSGGNDRGNASVTQEVFGGAGQYTVSTFTVTLTDV